MSKEILNIKNTRLLNPKTGITITIGDITIDLSSVNTKVIKAIYNATIKEPPGNFALLIPSDAVNIQTQNILTNRNILNTPKGK